MFTRKETATYAQRIEILDWYHANKQSQVKTAQHFSTIYPNIKLTQPRVSDWLGNEARWRADAERYSGSASRMKRVRQTEHPEITEMMEIWITQALNRGVKLTGELLRQKWTEFADIRKIPEEDRLTLSSGWLTRLKQRMGIKEFKSHGEAGSADPNDVEAERRRIQELIKSGGYSLRDIFNMDETGLFYACVAFLCLDVHALTNRAECHLTVDFRTRNSRVLKGKKIG